MSVWANISSLALEYSTQRRRDSKSARTAERVLPVFRSRANSSGDGQLIPIGRSSAAAGRGAVVASPVLIGLHHDYRQAAWT